MRNNEKRNSAKVTVSIQSIVAATDFSSSARHAAERAAMLAATAGARRGVLLHVLEKSLMDDLRQFISASEEVKQGIFDDALQSLDALAEEVVPLADFAMEPEVRTGSILDTIIEAASEFDLLALGARGRHPVRALSLGTTSQRILSKTRQPVLVVKRKPHTAYQRVLVAVDFSSYSRKALAYGRAVAPQALICLVHIFRPLFEKTMISTGISDKSIEEYRIKARIHAEAEMTRFIQAEGIESDNLLRLVEYGHPPASLPEIAAKQDVDLIILGKHGRSRIEEFLIGSVTLHVLAQSRCDVLVVQ
jgi:nucleotide-binding universal stress UspA family protein